MRVTTCSYESNYHPVYREHSSVGICSTVDDVQHSGDITSTVRDILSAVGDTMTDVGVYLEDSGNAVWQNLAPFRRHL